MILRLHLVHRSALDVVRYFLYVTFKADTGRLFPPAGQQKPVRKPRVAVVTDKALEPYRVVVEDDDKAVRHALGSSARKEQQAAPYHLPDERAPHGGALGFINKTLTSEDVLRVVHSA